MAASETQPLSPPEPSTLRTQAFSCAAVGETHRDHARARSKSANSQACRPQAIRSTDMPPILGPARHE